MQQVSKTNYTAPRIEAFTMTTQLSLLNSTSLELSSQWDYDLSIEDYTDEGFLGNGY